MLALSDISMMQLSELVLLDVLSMLAGAYAALIMPSRKKEMNDIAGDPTPNLTIICWSSARLQSMQSRSPPEKEPGISE